MRLPARAVPAAVAVVATVAVTAITVLVPRTTLAQTCGDLAILLASWVATVCCARAGRRGGGAGRAWTVLAAATGTWSAAQLLWTWYGITRSHHYPFPSLADLGYLAYGVPAGVGLLLFPRSTVRRRFAGARVMLDALVVASALLFVSWATVLGPLFSAGGSGLAHLVSLAYPVVDVAIASLVLTLGMRAPAGARRSWVLLGSGMVLLAATDSTFASLTDAGQTGTTGTPLVAGWVVAFLLIALAATAPSASAPVGRVRHFTVVQELLPLAPALAAIVVAALTHFDTSGVFLTVNFALVLAALTVQQVVAALDKVRLANGLEDTVASRTADLQTAQDRFGLLVRSSDEAIVSTTTAGVLTSWNPAAERLYGYAEAEMLGRPISVLVPAELASQEQGVSERVARGEQLRSHETERVCKDGSRVPVALTVSPIREGGIVTGISAIGHDITERRQHEAELASARTEALEASRAKSEFLATMSHEIRTPMNGVIGLTGLLLGTALDETQHRYATGVRGAGQALLAIIDDILDFSKLEAGKVELEDAPFDPRQLVEEVGVLLSATAAGKRLELVAFCDPDMPAGLRGDSGRLRQVLINLASNAVKFTARGEVVLRARFQPGHGGASVVEFSVTDTGIGVAPADQGRLFEPFAQADASTTRRFGGTGLGLAICRRLVSAMDGELSMDSQAGVGSTFRFTVPLAVSTPPVRAEMAAAPLAGRRVLVVDDNATNRLILCDQLTAWELQTDAAEDAEAGWQRLQEAVAEGRPYDVAVLDMCMPDVNGLALAGWIAADPALAATATMILTSAGPLDSTVLGEAGVRACVSKPVRSSELHDTLLHLAVTDAVTGAPTATSTAAPVDVASTPSVPTPRGPLGRVLVVEDNAVNQLVASAVLRNLGYDVDIAADGRLGLEALSASRYAAVLMDCHMPEMDGFAATTELRRREGTGRRTPVIAMTAGVLADDRERCTAAGMDDFVAKPVDVALLSQALTRWVERAPAETPSRPPTPQNAAVASGPVHSRPAHGGSAHSGSVRSEGGLDEHRLSVLRAIGPADGWGMLPAVIDAFVKAAPETSDALRAAAAVGDAPALEALLHRLRGAAANLGARQLAETCGLLETALGAEGAIVQVLLDDVHRELADGCRALSALLAARP